MARRALNIATVISTVLLAVAAVLFFAGYVFNPWDHYVSLSDSSHVALWGQGIDSQVVFFNDAEYGPYRGSIIALADDNGNVYPPFLREEAFGFWGVYYRYFERPTWKLWTLMVSMWYPIRLFAVLPMTRLLRRAFRRGNS